MKVTVIGGGTGSSAVLKGLKGYSDLDLSVVVSMADDGGSNAVIRDEFGLLPLSDVRKSIIALSPDESNEILRSLFTYRFSDAEGLSGHTVGNLMMTALSKVTSGEREAVEKMSDLFNVKGSILPVTYDDYRIVAKYDDGTVLEGEHLIDEPDIDGQAKIVEFKTDPEVFADSSVLDSINKADYIIIGPGDLYTTTLSSITVRGMSDSLKETDAQLIYVTNLMSKIGQTRHQTHKEIEETLKRYIGRDFDYILVNKEQVPKRVLKYYRSGGEHLIKDDLGNDARIIREDLIADEIFNRDKGDDLVRSIVRHDHDSLGWALYKLMKEQYTLPRE